MGELLGALSELGGTIEQYAAEKLQSSGLDEALNNLAQQVNELTQLQNDTEQQILDILNNWLEKIELYKTIAKISVISLIVVIVISLILLIVLTHKINVLTEEIELIIDDTKGDK